MKKLIFYDLDGTLADTRKDIVLAANHMIAVLGAPASTEREIQSYVGWGLRDLVAKCLRTGDSKLIDRGTKIFRRYYLDHLLDHTRLYAGVEDVLNYFRSRRQVVLTNKPDVPTQRILEGLGIRSFFSDVIAGDSPYPKKPDPGAMTFVMEREKVSAGEALFVGDSAIDLEASRHAGVEMAAVSHGFMSEDELKSHGPAALFSNFKDLLEHAQKAGW